MTPSTRPTEKRAWTVWKTAQNVVSHTAHSPVLFLADEKEKIKDKNVVASTVQIYAISSERQHAWTPRATDGPMPTLVGGGTVAFRHTTRRTTAVFDSSGRRSDPLPPPVTFHDGTIGLTGGVDIPVRLSARLLLIPTLRVHYLFDDGDVNRSSLKRGVSSVITRLGVGAGVRF